MDLEVWNTFLRTPEVFCRPFLYGDIVTAQEIDLFSDASGKLVLGQSVKNHGCMVVGILCFWSVSLV